jgi:hypothetical protein
MNVQINQLVKSLIKKDSIEQCSLQELEQFAERHPYFGAAQLLLTKKLKEENSSRYDEQLQKTFLFFNNPLWVQHLLNETGHAEIIVAEKNQEVNIPAPAVTEQTTASKEEDRVLIEEVDIPAPAVTEQTTASKEEDRVLYEEVPVLIEHAPELTATPILEENEIATPLIIEEKKIPEEKPKEELLFEPFHTVDYFASQGIKIREEEKPADRFGKQLRSFTDWLKTMKRLPVNEMAKNISPASEKNVEQLAQHSLDQKEVITETMAEVWVKQGNPEKAIQVYQKLSLLDPAKSVYFAAKIDDLKKKN